MDFLDFPRKFKTFVLRGHLSVRGETWRQNSRRVNVPVPGPPNAHSAVPNVVAAHVAVPKTAENDGAQNHD